MRLNGVSPLILAGLANVVRPLRRLRRLARDVCQPNPTSADFRPMQLAPLRVPTVLEPP